mmetsp:Transcript_8087/g.24934  ORF Transcript_8087/g.24934 Transcript_8087/m.24934 type:complete len:416 (+) Transcript_8087:108-1355(+)
MEAAAQDARPGASERASAGRPGQFKATLKRDEEAARRRSALSQQQSEARSGRIADVRRIAMEALLGGDQQNDVEEEVEVEEECEEEEEGGGDAEMGDDRRRRNRRMTRLRRLHRTLFFARQLQVPDWMLAVPEDLAASWLMLVRPEGDRCLFLSDGGRVEVRRKNGYVLERFTDSRMPRGLTILDVVCIEGAPAAEPTAQADTSGSIVVDVDAAPPEEPEPQGECRLASAAAADVDMGGGGAGGRRAGRGAERGRGRGGQAGGRGRRGRPKGDRTYAVCDVLIWGDSELASAEAECRMFWLSSRFSEISEKRDESQNMRHSASALASSLSPQISTSQTAYVRSPLGRPRLPLPPAWPPLPLPRSAPLPARRPPAPPPPMSTSAAAALASLHSPWGSGSSGGAASTSTTMLPEVSA